MTGEHRVNFPWYSFYTKCTKNQICQNLSIFVGYPLKMKISTEFLQSFCTRNQKKSEFIDQLATDFLQEIDSVD